MFADEIPWSPAKQDVCFLELVSKSITECVIKGSNKQLLYFRVPWVMEWIHHLPLQRGKPGELLKHEHWSIVCSHTCKSVLDVVLKLKTSPIKWRLCSSCYLSGNTFWRYSVPTLRIRYKHFFYFYENCAISSCKIQDSIWFSEWVHEIMVDN